MFGPNVVVRSNSHSYKRVDIPINQQGVEKGEIHIQDDVWISANAVILPNVILRRGTIVAAGAVVTKSTEQYDIVAGIPAIKIKNRKNSNRK